MEQKTKDDIEVTVAKLRGVGAAGSGEAYHVVPAKESLLRKMLVELVEIVTGEKAHHDYIKAADTKVGTEFAAVHVNRQIEERKIKHGLVDATEVWPPKEDPLKSDPQVAEQQVAARENELSAAGPSDAIVNAEPFDGRQFESPSDRGELDGGEAIAPKEAIPGPINEHPLTLGEIETPTVEPVAGEKKEGE